MLVDTSAWAEYLRGTGSPEARRLRRGIEDGERLLVLDVVLAELLCGPVDEVAAGRLARFLATFDEVPAAPVTDHERAAALYRASRREGRTVRSIVDCLVAAAALRLDVPLLARDRDFEVLAAVSDLALVAVEPSG